jgi:hypothetical protein
MGGSIGFKDVSNLVTWINIMLYSLLIIVLFIMAFKFQEYGLLIDLESNGPVKHFV